MEEQERALHPLKARGVLAVCCMRTRVVQGKLQAHWTIETIGRSQLVQWLCTL